MFSRSNPKGKGNGVLKCGILDFLFPLLMFPMERAFAQSARPTAQKGDESQGNIMINLQFNLTFDIYSEKQYSCRWFKERIGRSTSL